MSDNFCVFDQFGKLRDFSETELKSLSLSPERRARFDALRSAAQAATAAENALADAQKLVTERTAALADAALELRRLKPLPTFLDQWRAAFK